MLYFIAFDSSPLYFSQLYCALFYSTFLAQEIVHLHATRFEFTWSGDLLRICLLALIGGERVVNITVMTSHTHVISSVM